ncbi:MAG: alpha/beta hydrolase [Eubacteriales bacterium]|nr:alpha/beta hydrolase [Eubacteriales bacterium]
MESSEYMKKSDSQNRKGFFKSWIRKILAIFFLCIVFIVIGMGIYLSNYYHSNDYNKRTVQRGIDMVEEKIGRTSFTVFIPQGTMETGLIFYPGGKVEYDSYVPLMSRLARKGIFCILIHMPYNIAFFDANAADGIPEKYPEIKEWYLAGHSLGGVVAESYLEKNKEDYKGMIYLASYGTKDIHDTNLRVLSIYGDSDQVVNVDKIKESRDLMPEDYEEHIIEGGNHASFGNYGDQKGDGESKITPQEQWLISADLITQWMESK